MSSHSISAVGQAVRILKLDRETAKRVGDIEEYASRRKPDVDSSDVVPRTQTPTPARERSAAAFRIDGNAAATLSCNTLTVYHGDGAGHFSSTTTRHLPRTVFVCRARNLSKTRPTHSLSSLFTNGRLCRWPKLRAMDEKSYLPGKQFLVPYLAEA